MMPIQQSQVEHWLREILGPQVTFRPGQWEAITALVDQRQRVLVVQRTGWGKSLVYFLATRLLRAQGAGMTILISPLLALMRNQIDEAQQWGLKVATLNSDNSDEHERIEQAVLRDQVDLLLISPERLANDRFRDKVWNRLRQQIGLLVIDEAHCISDWGHDFRPNYRRIMGLLDEIPPQTPVLGTTATANDRVVADVAEILGAEMNIQRGPLTRESLALYVYPEPMDAGTRLTLLSHLLNHIPGSGIIYCTTTRDCLTVADWLQAEGHAVKPYFADVQEFLHEDRAALEQQLLDNGVKALVSSVALGMGFNKGDLHFVIHYQLPGNLIGYYQQIGRAGRSIDKAHIILMYGPGDEDIQQYFIQTAFPSPQQVTETITALAQHGPLRRNELQRYVNVRSSALERILTHLEVEGIIERSGSDFHLARQDATPDYERWAGVTAMRQAELERMKAYAQETGCLMRFIAEELDDPQPVERCGRCKNCTGASSKFQPDVQTIERAQRYLRGGKALVFAPRKRWPVKLAGKKNTVIKAVNEPGVALANYYEDGWGQIVKIGRAQNAYGEELVDAAAEVIAGHWQTLPEIIVAVPSVRRPTMVPGFAQRLAFALNLPYVVALKHLKQHPPQVEMHNSYQQMMNVMGCFSVTVPLTGESILLVDDIADSKWTFTVLGALLQEHGSGPVYPFALAVTNVTQ